MFYIFSVMRRYRTNVSYSVCQSVTLRTELTDVTLVSEDTYSRLVILREGFKNPSHGICPLGGYPPHSGPGGCRINLSKCTKNAAKRGNVTLTIAYHENEINLYGSFKKK